MISTIFVSIALLAVSVPSFAQKPKHQDLCRSGFNLKVKVEPGSLVGSSDPNASEIEVSYLPASKKGKAIRHDTDQSGSFTEAQCQQWAPLAMRWFDQAKFEASSKERRGLVCVNIATVIFAQNRGAPQTSRICLADAAKDAASTAFKHFYDQTDAMVSAAVSGGL